MGCLSREIESKRMKGVEVMLDVIVRDYVLCARPTVNYIPGRCKTKEKPPPKKKNRAHDVRLTHGINRWVRIFLGGSFGLFLVSTHAHSF